MKFLSGYAEVRAHSSPSIVTPDGEISLLCVCTITFERNDLCSRYSASEGQGSRSLESCR